MFGIFSKLFTPNKENNTDTVNTEESIVSKVVETKTAKQNLEDICNSIAKKGIEYFNSDGERHNKLELKSEYDSTISVDINPPNYDGNTHFIVWWIQDNVKMILTFDTGKRSDQLMVQNPFENNEHLLERLYRHFESFESQLEGLVSQKKQELNSLFEEKEHIRIWFKDISEVATNYDKHKGRFKLYAGTNEKYKSYRGRFVFNIDTSKTTIENVVSKFPDADLIELYSPETQTYEMYDLDSIRETLLF